MLTEWLAHFATITVGWRGDLQGGAGRGEQGGDAGHGEGPPQEGRPAARGGPPHRLPQAHHRLVPLGVHLPRLQGQEGQAPPRRGRQLLLQGRPPYELRRLLHPDEGHEAGLDGRGVLVHLMAPTIEPWGGIGFEVKWK